MKTAGRTAGAAFSARILDWTSHIAHSRLFWSILALKVISSVFFASPYLTDLFVPFLDRFAGHPTGNPYEYFWNHGLTDNFPYPPLMLYLVSLPRLVLNLIGLEHIHQNVVFFLYRLPLLAADVSIFLVLCRWMRPHVQKLIWLYWASPVTFYISYMHGQLDAIPVALLLLSLYFVFTGRYGASAILLGCALATKTHIILALPFILAYLWQHTAKPVVSARYSLIALGVFVLFNAPYVGNSAMLNMVFMNSTQARIGLAYLDITGDGLHFYIVPALMIALVTYSLNIHIHNRNLLLAFIGFSFGLILIFVLPMPGWYYWIIPLFAYFFARTHVHIWIFYFVLQIAYFCYFGLIPISDFGTLGQWGGQGDSQHGNLFSLVAQWGLDNDIMLNIAFTLLQTSLLLCCVILYYQGVRLPQKHMLTARPFMIGVAGDSGAGKSTLSESLRALFDPRNLNVICGDDMHKWQRGDARWTDVTHLDPRANELHTELNYLKLIRQNKIIWRRHYDHGTGRFTAALPIKPSPIMVLEGLHTFYLKPSRDLYDLKVFVKPDVDLLRHRKVMRDMHTRNYTKEQVLAAVRQRMADSNKYIVSQERHADLVVSLFNRDPIPDDEIGNSDFVIQERLRITLSNAFSLDPILDDIQEIIPGGLVHFYDANDRQVIEFNGYLDEVELQALGERHLAELQNLAVYAPQWDAGWQGILQLVIGYCVFHVGQKT